MSKLLLTYCSFVIACVVVIVAFITATTYIQLAVAILLYPLLVFFAYKALPPKIWRYTSKKQAAATVQPPVVKLAEKAETARSENVGISDIDKRVFLKLIGGTGLFLFLFSIFNKKTESIFFKSLPPQARLSLEDTTGTKINPAQNHPTDGYTISDVDDNIISFYGFTKFGGAWYIMRADSDTGSFRYTKGDSNFSGNWTNREKLKYDYFSNVF